jgi:FKBP-type peptidyl-prolyl cis-trans isomerase SlyD
MKIRTLIVDDDVLESSQESGPLVYEHGREQIIPGLENALEGLDTGDSGQVDIGPDDAYGTINPELIIEIPSDQIRNGFIETGTVLQGKDGQGKTVQGIVREVGEEQVTVDFNHPLAGKQLHFDFEVIEVTP